MAPTKKPTKKPTMAPTKKPTKVQASESLVPSLHGGQLVGDGF
jgi:hypothetical protein